MQARRWPPTRVPILVLALTLALPLFASRWAIAAAQPSTDLSGGVFVVHRPPGLNMTPDHDPPPGGWCPAGQIADCESQENDYRPVDGNVDIWFVLVAFGQESEWCGVEFGIDYNTSVSIADCHMCVPSAGLEIPSDFWPESGSGTTLLTTDVPWTGTFQVVYYFLGYGYGGTFALTENVQTPNPTGFFNCFQEEFPADCYGAIGFGMPGVDCCPAPAASVPESESEPFESDEPSSWGTIKAIYQ